MGGRVTLEDIAEASGTSVASVSLALRNKPGVSRERRERILTAARSLGYARETPVSPDEHATTRRVTMLFQSLTSGPAAPLMDPFTSWVVTGIQEAAQDAGIELMVGAIRWNPADGTLQLPPSRLAKRPRDGVLLIGSYPEETIAHVLEGIGAGGFPVVQVDGSRPRPFMDCVGTMNLHGARDATGHLIANGHHRIAFSGRLRRRIPSFAERHRGYLSALANHGLDRFEIEIINENEISPLPRDGDLPYTAVFVDNDYDATILMRLLQAEGIRVPDDVSVVGFDDTPHATQVTPALTTMRVDTLSMGRLAIDALRFRWRWPEAAPFMTSLQPTLIERRSVRRIGDDPGGTPPDSG
jgi:DNA-binding LacI/PurR family transcriptional regulator